MPLRPTPSRGPSCKFLPAFLRDLRAPLSVRLDKRRRATSRHDGDGATARAARRIGDHHSRKEGEAQDEGARPFLRPCTRGDSAGRTTTPLWLRSIRCFANRRSRSLGLTLLMPSTYGPLFSGYLTPTPHCRRLSWVTSGGMCGGNEQREEVCRYRATVVLYSALPPRTAYRKGVG